MSDIILCFSGGLDSTIAWYYLNKPKCIYFDCVDYSEAEKKAVFSINPDTIISGALDFREFANGDKNAYILHRNILMAGIASNYGSKVVLAGVKDDVVQDKNPEAFYKMSLLLSETSKKKVNVISPFWCMTKSEVVKWFLDNVPDAEQILKTSVSCYNNKDYCGECPSCFRKANALWDNGIQIPFHNTKLMAKYNRKAVAGDYMPERNESIIKFINEYILWTFS